MNDLLVRTKNIIIEKIEEMKNTLVTGADLDLVMYTKKGYTFSTEGWIKTSGIFNDFSNARLFNADILYPSNFNFWGKGKEVDIITKREFLKIRIKEAEETLKTI